MTNADMERPEWLENLTAALSEQSRLDRVVALRPGIGARPAAVLILIGDGPDGPEIMFVERAAGMRTHPGQIAFPGGAAEDGDHDLADTALREAAEETGVDRSGIEVLGVLPPAHVDVSGFDVTAVIAWWRKPSPVEVMDTREAASIDIVPVAVLTDPGPSRPGASSVGLYRSGVRGEWASHLGPYRAPARWRTRPCWLAAAMEPAPGGTHSRALPDRPKSRPRRSRCPLMITARTC